MSFGALKAALATSLRCVEKGVLIALANLADDSKGDTAWPSMETLADHAGLGIRATRQAVVALEAAGHISRRERPGKGVIYWIHPGTSCRPAQDTPRHEMPPHTTAPDAATPARDAANPLKNPKPPEPSGSAPKGADRSQKRAADRGEAKGSRLAADWQPDTLPSPLAEAVAAQGPAWVNRELARFRDYWTALAGPKAFSADWQARWRRWLDDGLERAGKSLTLPQKPAPAAEIVRAIGDGLDGFCHHLAEEIGTKAYGAWFDPNSIIPEGKGVIIRAKSAFAVDYIRTNFMPGIEAAARRAGLDHGAIAIATMGKANSGSEMARRT